MTPRPLAGVDAQIFGHLSHLVAIGKHRGAGKKPLFTAADVARVAATWLAPRRIPAASPQVAQLLTEQRARTQAAERRARGLATQLEQLQAPRSGGRVVELSRLRAAVISMLAEGTPRDVVADELHTSRKNVTNTLSRAVADIGAHDVVEAIALIRSGQVQIRVRGRNSGAAA